MGGRVAEELLQGPEFVTTGAGSDMQAATDMARRFCMHFSMSKLGLASYGRTEPSDKTKEMVDREVDEILKASPSSWLPPPVRSLARQTDRRPLLPCCRYAAAMVFVLL